MRVGGERDEEADVIAGDEAVGGGHRADPVVSTANEQAHQLDSSLMLVEFAQRRGQEGRLAGKRPLLVGEGMVV